MREVSLCLLIVIVKVSVKGSMSVDEGHKVATIIKERLKREKNVGDVVVHINPEIRNQGT